MSSPEHGDAFLPPSAEGLPLDVPTPEQRGLTLPQRVGEIFTAAATDYQESKSKLANIATGIGTVAIQGLDRARASVVFVPTIAVNVLQETQSPTQAALAAGASFAAWCGAVGGATTEGLKQYPQAVSTFERNFPGVVGFFEDSLPGLEAPSRDRSMVRRIGGRMLTGVKRGLTVSGIGTAAYASTAVAQGRSRKDAHLLNANASLDGGSAIGAVVYGVGEAIIQIGHKNPELAQQIQDHASDIKLWYGVAGAMMAGQYISNRFKKWRASKSSDK